MPLVSGPVVPRNEKCVQGDLRVSGLSLLLVFGVPKKLSGGSHSSKAFISPWTGFDNKIKNSGRNMKKSVIWKRCQYCVKQKQE